MTENAVGANPGVTFVNVFEISADQVDTFIKQWRVRAQLMSKAPGFRDTKLHRALSPDTRFQLINVAHWDSEQAWQNATANPEFQLARTEAVTTADHPVRPNLGLYQVAIEFE
jgi:heme-degrading monooxygenase HmoA